MCPWAGPTPLKRQGRCSKDAWMAKPVELTTRALKDLEKVRDYCTTHFGNEKADRIIKEIFDHIAILECPGNDFVNIGMVDNDFTHLKHDYRKIFKHYCKITYREGKSNIYVIRIFDT